MRKGIVAKPIKYKHETNSCCQVDLIYMSCHWYEFKVTKSIQLRHLQSITVIETVLHSNNGREFANHVVKIWLKYGHVWRLCTETFITASDTGVKKVPIKMSKVWGWFGCGSETISISTRRYQEYRQWEIWQQFLIS